MQEKPIIDFWSLKDLNKPMRPNQQKVLQWMEIQSAKFLVVQSPVGSGKSSLGMTYSSYLTNGIGSSFILTPQKILQKQYESSFKHRNIFSLYGKSNYPCNQKKTNCEIGGILKPDCDNCKYKTELKASVKSKDLVLNYSLALSMFKYNPELYQKRKLMIMDECHTLERHLTEFDSVIISDSRCKQINVNFNASRNFSDLIKWIRNSYVPKLITKLEQLEQQTHHITDGCFSNELTSEEEELLKQQEELQDHHDSICEIVIANKQDFVEQEYVLISGDGFHKIKRLTGKSGFSKFLEPMAEKFIFMSATIIDVDEFCKNLGLNKEDVSFIDIDSDFPSENRPVFYIPCMKVNKDWKNDENNKSRQFLLTTVKDLLNVHKEESGIIHSGNFDMAKWLVEELTNEVDHLIFSHNPDSGDNRDEVITAFMKSKKPSILISPSITEGLDLYDDLSRFAIFTKIPYPYLGDQWVAKRMNMSQQWYSLQALINVLQGCGRVVRSSTDKGSVYILDSCWDMLYNKSKHKIPDWWKQSYKKV